MNAFCFRRKKRCDEKSPIKKWGMGESVFLVMNAIVLTNLSYAFADSSWLVNWRKYTYEAIPPSFQILNDGVQVKASGYNSKNKPELSIDGNTESKNYWACEQLPASLTYKYPVEHPFAEARVIFSYAPPQVYKFYIEVSKDGKAWKKVADRTQNNIPSSQEGFRIPLSPVERGRFLRITVTGNSIRTCGARIVEMSLLKRGIALSPGIHGAVTTLDKIAYTNAIADESKKAWRTTVWRNERVHGQFSLWTGTSVPQVRMSVSDLSGSAGTIKASNIQTRFVRYVLGKGNASFADILDTVKILDMPANSFRPIWLTVKVPSSAKAGVYRGKLTVDGMWDNKLEFPMELTVLNAALPDPKNWSFFLDLWQHPWAVARYHGIEPFTHEHYRLMEPIYKELANAGQKVLTTTITELPWNHQNFDAYHSMIKRIKNPDGSWTQDYSLFDEYVEFGKKCGIGPDIHCYTLPTGMHPGYYTDRKTGNQMWVMLSPGTKEHEAYWGEFLADFSKHLEKKGWLGHVYIAMDECDRKGLLATAECMKKHAPQLKIALTGCRAPSEFKGIELENYCQSMPYVNKELLKDIKKRREKGMVTTFYVCCGPDRPNTFVHSAPSEMLWLGYYAASKDFDGFLRWAFVNWPKDPLFDAGFGNWPAGDTFLLYPGPRSSIRWEMLREGIEEYEKIRALRAAGADMKEIDANLSTYEYPQDRWLSNELMRKKVLGTSAAITVAAKLLKPKNGS